jgi:hypothetical protein
MTCKNHWTAQRKMSDPACELLPERCFSASDCPKKWMECKTSGRETAGFCVEPPMSTPAK